MVKRSIPVLLIVLVSYITIYRNLSSPQIRMWDEATYANNSIDMAEGGNIFVIQHQGKTDWYNTKPPFVIWLQAICMKVFGVNEFSVRLPSATFGLFTCLLIYFFCIIVLNNLAIGFLSALILLTSKGYISNHAVLTGDLDSSLVFWLTLGLLSFIFLVLKKPEKKITIYFLISLSLICGFLTKGIAGFFFVPAMAIILILNKDYGLLRDKRLYLSAFLTISICASYYMIREFLTPGYTEVVLKTEILRYGVEVMSWHVHPFDFYYQQLLSGKYTPYIYLLMLCLPALLIAKKNLAVFKLLIFLVIAALGYFILISYPAVKLEWYDAPLYPILALLVAISIYEFVYYITSIFNLNKDKTLILNITYLCIGLAFVLTAFKELIKTNNYPEESIYSMEFEGAYAKYIDNNLPEIEDITVYKVEKNIEHFDQILFYKRAFEIEGRLKIRITSVFDFKAGEKVMAFKEEDKSYLLKHYDGIIINKWQEGIIFDILKVK